MKLKKKQKNGAVKIASSALPREKKKKQTIIYFTHKNKTKTNKTAELAKPWLTDTVEMSILGFQCQTPSMHLQVAAQLRGRGGRVGGAFGRRCHGVVSLEVTQSEED